MIRQVASIVLIMASALAAAPPAPPATGVERSLAVASYGSGQLPRVQLTGTQLAPKASGVVRVSTKQGSVQLAISVRDLPAPTSFGPEFLSYVVWAVTAEGRTRNLGEIVVAKGKGKLTATTQAQAFGLMLTAEPYFAVGTPSDRIVLQNSFAATAPAAASVHEARFETFEAGAYSASGLAAPAATVRPPFDLFQARNAVRVARAFGAESFAGDLLAGAALTLEQAEALAKDKKTLKLSASKAREAVQSAEAARSLAVRRQDEARVAAEKADAAGRAAAAREEASRAQAEAARAQADAAAAQSEAARAHATAEEEARRRAQAEQSAAVSEQARHRAELEKQALRARLLQQLNLVLETRDSARGLIVNLGDVLFDLNKFTLRPEAREKLAKLSGVVLGNPGLKLAVEGHTDATGSDEYNRKLSEDRAGAVRDYLVEQKIDPEMIVALGFGKTRPVASNDTADGRQKNRRVEIVVSGDIIGTEIEQQKTAPPTTQ